MPLGEIHRCGHHTHSCHCHPASCHKGQQVCDLPPGEGTEKQRHATKWNSYAQSNWVDVGFSSSKRNVHEEYNSGL